VSNPDSFIEEVTEEVRRDRLFGLFKKYGWIAGLLIAGVVGGAAFTEWQKATKAAEAQEFGDGLLTALDAATPQDRITALAAVPTDKGSAADKHALQQLLVASDAERDKAASLAALDLVVQDANVSLPYRDLATLRRVILVGSDMPIAERRAILDPIAAPGRAFRPLALEQMAYLSVEAGDLDAAITQLRALSQDQQAPAGLRERVSQMILALGGESAQG
jgi:hypothetical protein